MRNLSRAEFDVLVYLTGDKDRSMSAIADATGLPSNETENILNTLLSGGLISSDFSVADSGFDFLEPYRAKRVIFLAAGLGSRLRPATLNVPKPLVRVHGTPIICSAIQALIDAGIEDIYIVRGYLGEVFDQLLHTYPQIHFVDNAIYNETNNISSAMSVRHLLQNAYIMEADLLIENPSVFRKYNYTSNCLGVPVEKTDDWCVISENGVARQLVKGGENCHHLFSIYYMSREDGARLPAHLEELYNSPGGKDCFWDMTPMNVYNEHYHIEVVECSFHDIKEIDTYSELQEIDENYKIVQ